jgi:hypothetical protein
MKRTTYLLFTTLLALGIASPAQATLGPDTVLKGVDPAAWSRIHQRAEAITKAIVKTVPGAAKHAGCIAAYAQFTVYRHVQVLDAFSPDAGGTFYVHMSGQDTPDGYKNHQSGHVKVDGPKRAFAPQVTDAAEDPGGATDKLRDNVNEKCNLDDRGNGGGGRGTGAESKDGISIVEEWKRQNPNWDTDSAYGPPLFPEGYNRGQRVQNFKKAVQADGAAERLSKEHPGLDLRTIANRLVQGKTTGQDLEQLRFAIDAAMGAAGATYIRDSAGKLVTAPARVIPVWVVPPGLKDVVDGPLREPKPGEMY